MTFNGPDQTLSTDKHYSLDSEDDFRSGCRNVSHQQWFQSYPHLDDHTIRTSVNSTAQHDRNTVWSNPHYNKNIFKIQIGKQEFQKINNNLKTSLLLSWRLTRCVSQVNYLYMYNHSIILQALPRYVYTMYVTLTTQEWRLVMHCYSLEIIKLLVNSFKVSWPIAFNGPDL